MAKKITIMLSSLAIAIVGWAAQNDVPQFVNLNTAPTVASDFAVPEQQQPVTVVEPEQQLAASGALSCKGPAFTKCGRGVPRSLSSVLGKYFCSAQSAYQSVTHHSEVTITQRGDSLLVHNLYGAQSDVVASYDSTSGTLSIIPQELFVSDTYGSSWIHTWDGATPTTYGADAPIQAVVQTDGSLKFTTPWGIYVHDGTYAGGVYNAFTSAELGRANATITITPFSGSDTTFDARVEQSVDNELTIINFDGHAHEAVTTLLADSSSRMGPQYVTTMSLYGDFKLYSATTAGKISKYAYITGAALGPSTLSLGPWGIFCVKSTTIAYATAKQTVVTLNDGCISYPQAVTPSFSGNGTADSPYLITSFDDLKSLSAAVNGGLSTQGVNYALCADIDASVSTGSSRFYPIGYDASTAFNGTFDGQGHTISNFTLDGHGDFNVGLFGYLGSNAEIKNLTVKNAEVSTTGRYVGIVAGYSLGSITSVSTQGTVSGAVNSLGGIVGYTEGVVRQCDFSGTVTGGAEVGGIAGLAKDSVVDCHAVADLRMTGYYSSTSYGMGGIVGDLIGTSKKSAIAERCYFSGTAYDQLTQAYLGGIAGGLYNGHIEQCFNVGTMTTAAGQGTGGTWRGAGGITGYLSNGEVTNCYNAGTINAPNANQAAGIVGYAGGYTGSNSTIHSSYSSGMVANNTDFEYGAVLGSYFTQSALDVQNVYYDQQASGQVYASTGATTTSRLTSGEALQGFSDSVWTFTAGSYPMLKTLSGTPAATLSVAPMFLQNGESSRKVKTDFTVSASDNVEWEVLTNGTLSLNGTGINVNGTKVSLTGSYGYDHLLAINTTDNTYKYYDIYSAPSGVFSGDGTATNPYLIENKADLEKLSEAVNNSRQSFMGDYFKMTADIDLQQDSTFTGIASTGSGNRRFDGNFDGQNHTVHNFCLNSAATGGRYTGLFGLCGSTSTVSNVRVAADSEIKVGRYGAAVVGYSEGHVVNCRNYAAVTAADTYAAGVVGVLAGDSSLADSCYNSGSITSLAGIAGGICGYVEGSVTRSRNDGTVTDASANGTSILGGIAAASLGSIKNSLNTGSMVGGDQVGGIVGLNTKLSSDVKGGGQLIGNVNTGLVTGTGTYLGAIAGAVTGHRTLLANRYDGQICPVGAASSSEMTGAVDMLTSDLMSGTVPDDVSSDWTWTTDRYPMLNAFADEPLAALIDAVALKLDAVDNVNAVSENATVQAPDGAAWQAAGQNISLQGDALQVTAPTAAVATDTLTVAIDGFSRQYVLRIVPKVLDGKGSKDNPFLIKTAADMDALSQSISNYDLDYKGHYFLVVNDIRYGDSITAAGDTVYSVKFAPVAGGTHQFRGIFDGGSKKFAGVTYDDATAEGVGLFGTLGQGSIVQHLTIATGSISAMGTVGAVAGTCAGTLTDVHNQIDVTATSANYAGGLVGYALDGSQFVDCTNSGTVQEVTQSYAGGIVGLGAGAYFNQCENTGTIITSRGYAGGIVGSELGSITSCVNRGDIIIDRNYNYLGGIVGQYQAGTEITGCKNYGSVTASNYYVGGIAGGTCSDYAEEASLLTGCENYGTVSGVRYVGGIVGNLAAGHNVSNVQNFGEVTSTKGYTGGVAGYVSGRAGVATDIDVATNFGNVKVTGTYDYTAGIVGNNGKESTIAHSHNYGRITSSGGMCGGIAGANSGTATDCYNAAHVTGFRTGVGGIAGFTGTGGSIIRCANLDSVSTSGTFKTYGMAGGLVGYGYPAISDSHNLGAVTAPSHVGGIMGTNFSGISLTGVYNAELVVATDTTTAIGAANVLSTYTAGSGTIANVYYDSQVMPAQGADLQLATGLTTAALTELTPSSAYITATGCYPILASLSDSAVVGYTAATVVLADGETANDVRSPFTIGTPEGTMWTLSPNLTRDGNMVMATATGEAWLVKTCGSRSRRYHLNISQTSAVSNVRRDVPVAGSCYYDLTGRQMAEPSGVCIEVLRYQDGTTVSRKVLK